MFDELFAGAGFSRESVVGKLDESQREYTTSRERMWRHEEAHRLFQYF